MIIDFTNGQLVWDFDRENGSVSDISKIPDNNLSFLLDGSEIWNMHDTVGYDDVCVSVSTISENEFCFITFNGLCFTMRCIDGKIDLVNTKITK